MHVLLVSGAAPFSTRDVWEGYAHALTELGVTVTPYPVFSALTHLSIEAIGNDVVGKALDVRNDFDAAIFVDGLFFRHGRESVPLTLTAHGLLTAVLATDDPYEPLPGNVYTIRFTNERSLATRAMPYLPTAADPVELRFDPPGAPDIDLVFVGTIFPDRWPFIRDLARYCELEKITFEVHGHFIDSPAELQGLKYVRVDVGTVSAQERRSLYRRSKAVLNLFRSHDGAESLNPRVYEVASMGSAVLLTNTRAELEDLLPGCTYTFTTLPELTVALNRLLTDDVERAARANAAAQIVRAAHQYRDRAAQLVDALLLAAADDGAYAGAEPTAPQLGFIYGAGRTGSTWLLEMLTALPDVRGWNEPCFGWIFANLAAHPDELDRHGSFFHRDEIEDWLPDAADLVRTQIARHLGGGPAAVHIVKDVNAPAAAPFVSRMFPEAKYLLLVRDPFDVLDSHIDMQRPESWHDDLWHGDQLHWTEEQRVHFLAQHIRDSFTLALRGFEACRADRRMRLSYEALLADPLDQLDACAAFFGITTDPTGLRQTVDAHRFDEWPGRTGRDAFRRFGRAGTWSDSPNFTATVGSIADRILGPLRESLGYATRLG